MRAVSIQRINTYWLLYYYCLSYSVIKLYFISFQTEAVELAQYFSQYGLVTDAKVIADDKNISKGLVQMIFCSRLDKKYNIIP